MVFPAVKLHQFHSLQLYDGLDIMFDLKIVDNNALKSVFEKKLDIIHLIPDMFIINTIEKCITIRGYKISDSTFIVNSNGTNININYMCCDVITGIEYLYQICKNHNTVIEYKIDRWDPKPYRPN